MVGRLHAPPLAANVYGTPLPPYLYELIRIKQDKARIIISNKEERQKPKNKEKIKK